MITTLKFVRPPSTSFVFRSYTTIPGVLQLGDQRLRVPSLPVKKAAELVGNGDNSKLKVAESLLHSKLDEFRTTMGYGRGIAAPQVNEHYRLVALNLGGDPEKYEILNNRPLGFLGGTNGESFSMWNPIITSVSEEMFTMWDDCMSFPHLMVRLNRHITCSIKFWTVVSLDNVENKNSILAGCTDTNLGVVEIFWENLPQDISELIQHETDHLDGVLSIDRSLDWIKDQQQWKHIPRNDVDFQLVTGGNCNLSSLNEYIIDRNEYLKNKEIKWDKMVDYTIVPTV
jgi:peptide deformylase